MEERDNKKQGHQVPVLVPAINKSLIYSVVCSEDGI